MRVAIMESPAGLLPGTGQWNTLSQQIHDANPDVLITNEMPFGPWLAESKTYDPVLAQQTVGLHETGLEALKALKIPTILSSRPVPAGDRLANEAFTLVDGVYTVAHHKHYFPDEGGFYETAWYRPAVSGFQTVQAGELNVGFLLCTELFFNEWARHYRQQGANLIAVPRASGTSVDQWLAAARMAAIVSGCYVASSNRAGKVSKDLTFGGKGFCITPDGEILGTTTPTNPILTFTVDPAKAKSQQTKYPCYVKELE